MESVEFLGASNSWPRYFGGLYEFCATEEAHDLVTKSAAFAARLVPLRVENRKLICAGMLPIDWSRLRAFEARVCREVEVVAASSLAVEAGLKAVYGHSRFAEADDLADAVAKRPRREAGPVAMQHARRITYGPMKVMAVTSGKGGVGKSSTTANLAISLAKQGFKVGVIDCDFGLSNLHVLLGVKPSFNLGDVMAGRKSMRSAFELVHGGLYLLAGPTGAVEYADLNYASLQNSGAGLSELESEFDFLLIDTAAGIHDGVLSLLMAADEVILVMTPDPASILDAYVTARALFERRPRAIVRCIVNQAPSETEARLIFAKFMTFVGLNTIGRSSYLGKIQFDKLMVKSSRSRTPIALGFPRSQPVRDLAQIAARVAGNPKYIDPTANLLSRFFGGHNAA